MLYSLSLFSVTLPANPDKSLLKNMPKSVSLLALTEKRNRVVTGEDTDSGNWVVAEDSYFWEQQCNEHPRYSKTLENTANKKANKLNDNLTTKTNAKLNDAFKKMRKPTSKKDTAVSQKQKETVMSNLVVKASALKKFKIKKELLDAKKELANTKKGWESYKKALQQYDSWPSRGDSIEHYWEKERIKLSVFEGKTATSHRNKVVQDRRKARKCEHNGQQRWSF